MNKKLYSILAMMFLSTLNVGAVDSSQNDLKSFKSMEVDTEELKDKQNAADYISGYTINQLGLSVLWDKSDPKVKYKVKKAFDLAGDYAHGKKSVDLLNIVNSWWAVHRDKGDRLLVQFSNNEHFKAYLNRMYPTFDNSVLNSDKWTNEEVELVSNIVKNYPDVKLADKFGNPDKDLRIDKFLRDYEAAKAKYDLIERKNPQNVKNPQDQ